MTNPNRIFTDDLYRHRCETRARRVIELLCPDRDPKPVSRSDSLARSYAARPVDRVYRVGLSR